MSECGHEFSQYWDGAWCLYVPFCRECPRRRMCRLWARCLGFLVEVGVSVGQFEWRGKGEVKKKEVKERRGRKGKGKGSEREKKGKVTGSGIRKDKQMKNSLIFISSNLLKSPEIPWATNTSILAIISDSGLTRLLITACMICGSLAFGANWLSANLKVSLSASQWAWREWARKKVYHVLNKQRARLDEGYGREGGKRTCHGWFGQCLFVTLSMYSATI